MNDETIQNGAPTTGVTATTGASATKGMTPAGPPERSGVSGRARRRLERAAVLLVAAVLPLLIWAVAVPIAGLDLTVGTGPTAQVVSPSSIVVAVLVAGCCAWGVLALLERFSRRSGRTFAIIGWTVLAVSLLGPLLSAVSGVVLVVLLAMHLATGAALVLGLPRAARRLDPAVS
ncbi:DUF6069 family protein [Agromyces aureus]|uniref:Uncharacterized protein n=1 Tax=Agromyces aureus TaxID=453304 RepID=A0A191WCX6_9MICO|nr:DUF6069 family protein [Agromyces aureus]ANJ26082.1 hypothetical protein ATC03_04380 [Agromyces aureus]